MCLITHYGSCDLFSWRVSKKGLSVLWDPWGSQFPSVGVSPSPWTCTGKLAPEWCCPTFPGTSSLPQPLAWSPVLGKQQQFNSSLPRFLQPSSSAPLSPEPPPDHTYQHPRVTLNLSVHGIKPSDHLDFGTSCGRT